MVYWITGLSGAGKTTLGKLFYEMLKVKEPNSVFFDGDSLREVFGNDLGYSEEDRKKCAMRYSRMCKLMDDQNINVVICTISMFHFVRKWNRLHIKNYIEIYIKVPMEELVRRNQKNMYSSDRNELVGREIIFEEPKNPDIVLVNDGSFTINEVKDILIKEINNIQMVIS